MRNAILTEAPWFISTDSDLTQPRKGHSTPMQEHAILQQLSGVYINLFIQCLEKEIN